MTNKITFINQSQTPLSVGVTVNGTQSGLAPYQRIAPGASASVTPSSLLGSASCYSATYQPANLPNQSPYTLSAGAVFYTYPNATVTIGASVVPSLPYVNLLANPGFETGDLTGWTASSSAARVENGDPLTGAYDAILTPSGSTPVTISQSVVAPCTGTYVLTGYGRVFSSQVTATLSATVNGVSAYSQQPAQDNNYHLLRGGFQASAGQTITVTFSVSGSNYGTLDDVSLTGPQNQIQNASFETNQLAPWGHSGNVGIESSNPHGSGSYDAYLYPGEGAPALLEQTIVAPCAGTYVFTAYAQGDLASGALLGVDLSGVNAWQQPIASGGYAPYSCTIEARKGDRIRVWCSAEASSGWVTLDDTSLILTQLPLPL